MSTLKVEPHALVSYSNQIDRAREDSEAIRAYITKNATEGTGGEFYAIAEDGNSQAVAAVQNTFNRLSCMLDYSALELRASANYYGKTDLQAAINLDRALPEIGEYCLTAIENEINVCLPVPFNDSRLPEQNLKTPDLEPESPVNKMGWMDYFSPTAWALKGFDVILGFDPMQEVQNKLFGDWEVLAKMQPVLNNTAFAVHDIAYNVQAGATALQDYWQGNAGDAAYRYFTEFATSIDQLRAPLVEMGEAYRTMAEAVWEAGDAIGGLLKGMCDAAIIGALAAAAGTGTALTGAGAALGYGVAAAQAVYILGSWAQVTKYLAYADSAIKVFRSVINNAVSNLDAVRLPELNGAAGYDHPLTGMGAHV